jgi:hypothetical protein
MSVHGVCSRSRQVLLSVRPQRQTSSSRNADVLGRVFIVAVALCAAARFANAQTVWRIDAALSWLRAADAARSKAGVVSALAQQQVGPVAPVLSGTATIAGDSVAAAQAMMGVNFLPPWSDRAPIDVGAIVAIYGKAQGDRGQSRALYARQHLIGDRAGLWAGAAVGQIERTAAFASSAFDVAAWIVKGRTRFTLSASTTATTDKDVFEGSGFSVQPFAEKVRVADASGTFEFVGTKYDVELEFGGRFAIKGINGSRGYASGVIGRRITRLARLIFSGGVRLSDPLRGVPAWRFASIGLRFASPSVRVGPAPSHSGPPLFAKRIDDGRVRIIVGAPEGAQRVEISGSFTNWEPRSLGSGVTGWVGEFSAPSGAHRILVRVDGGEWRAPGNLTVEMVDMLGKRVGVIVIP